MGNTDAGVESVYRRLSPRTGKRVEVGTEQAIGLLSRLMFVVYGGSLLLDAKCFANVVIGRSVIR